MDLAEKQLICDLKQGSQYAFTQLYYQHSRDVYTLSYKYLADRALAEDMMQELFCFIWEIRETIDPERPFNRYLFTILKNRLLNSLRDKRENLSLDNVPEEGCVFEEDPTELSQEQLRILRQAINQLSPQKKKVFELKLTGRYSNQEIATQLAVSVNTIKVQYTQALKEVRKLLHASAFLWILLHLPFD